MRPLRAAATLALVLGCRPAPLSAPAPARGVLDLATPAPLPQGPRLSWELPRPQGNDLHAVTTGAEGVFAAGDSGTILRRENGQWRSEASGTRADLLALHTMQRDGTVWAAGEDGTLLRRAPGGGWERVVTNTHATLRALFSCSSSRQPAAPDAAPPAESLIAVGSAGTLLRVEAGRVVPLLPGNLPKEQDYSGVWGTSCEDLFIAGRGLWHITGPSLTRASDNVLEPMSRVIGSSSGTVFAAGDSGQEMTLKEGNWYVGSGDLIVHAFAGSGAGPFARVGQRGAIEVREVLQKDSEPQWEPIESNTLRDLLAAAFAGPRELYVVGQGGIILRWDGKGVTREQLALTELALLGVARFADSLIAVGEEGTILRHDGRAWARMESPTQEDLTAIWADDKRAFAVGVAGACLYFDGERWRSISRPSRNDLRAVSGRPGGPVYAVGSDGRVAELTDRTCWANQTPVTETLLGVAIDAANTVFAVGRSGVSLRRQKDAWVLEPTGTRADLTAIFIRGAEPPVALAAGDATLRWDGSRWQKLGPAPAGLNALFGSGPRDLYAAGARGLVARLVGDGWQRLDLDLTPDLNSLIGAGSGPLVPLVAVGAEGTIVRIDPGGAR